MPIYEYTCEKCSTKFEKLLKTMNGHEEIACPKCGSTKTGRDLSVFAVGAQPAHNTRPTGCQGCAGAASCPMAEG